MMREKPILRVVSKNLIPPIMLFALYVQFHGDFGPGGGFQAGVIFASAFILQSLIIGVAEARRVARSALVRSLLAFGGILYVDSLSEADGPVPTYLDLLRVTAGTVADGLAAATD